ncbi:hypothetical protein [Leptospira sp. GIMC2001]|uniref:hypothetical protein n=1 Tax=Leptospira sp. GIMC2001 TaxID=1513297 RepID=UPI00234AE646|nr:hypothetical protein [Leptospira sp. GIMC2001]WCL48240.1 hypothetical protein O4O04_13095 [Leptospira sp. GIMC2001]
MGIFSGSDKKSDGSEWLDLSSLEMVDLSRDLNTSLLPEEMVFGKFTKQEIFHLMDDSGLLDMLKDRGYSDYNIEIQVLSELDNRIFIKTNEGKVLVHIRLKYSDFSLKAYPDVFKMVYIDWLLTQNIRFVPGTYSKPLFYGQEYPGLAIFVEITEFIRLLTKKIGAHGVFNIPEYFHDAVLFRNNFKFIDPIKEGQFRALIELSATHRVREVSNAIHNKKLVWSETGLEFEWFHGEMLTAIDPYLESIVFTEDYFKKVTEVRKNSLFSFLPSI